MLVAEFRIRISGKLKKEELLLLDPYLDNKAYAIEKRAKAIFKARLPANLEGKLKFSFEE